MGGICGFAGLGDRSLLKEMCFAVKHRGPSGEDRFLDRGIGLGIRFSKTNYLFQNRLVHNEDESIWIVLDGEIYDSIELIRQLEARGHSFYTCSDAEAIVHLYEELDVSSIEKLRGMFALAIWDSNKKRLLIARDKLGEKPVSYYFKNGVFLFASEIKSILQFEEVKREVNLDALDLYLTYVYVPTPHTMFKDIWKLPPGHYLTYEKNSSPTIKQYWDLDLSKPQTSYSEDNVIEQLDRLLREAVKIRLRGEPTGAFLSGGVDSSIVTSIASKLMDNPIETFALGYEEQEYNELHYAKMAADYLGTKHHEFIIGPEVFKLLPKLIWHMDEPHGDSGLIPLFYVSEKAKKYVSAVLTGDGGDELFWSYSWLVDADIVDHYFKLPKWIRKPITKIVDNVSRYGKEGFWGRMHSIVRYESINYSSFSPERRCVARMTRFHPKEIDDMYEENLKGRHKVEDTYSFALRHFRSHKNTDLASLRSYVTIKTVLLDNGLAKGDRMEAAASLETRHPLLDQDVVEFVTRLPACFKTCGSERKYILKKYAAKYKLVPKELLYRGKVGFGAPIEHWFNNELKDHLNQFLLENQTIKAYFKEEYIRKLLKLRVYEGAHKVFSLLTFALWHKIFIEQDDQSRLKPNVFSM